MEKYPNAKEELWKLKYYTMQPVKSLEPGSFQNLQTFGDLEQDARLNFFWG
jgi:hypothetical protein